LRTIKYGLHSEEKDKDKGKDKDTGICRRKENKRECNACQFSKPNANAMYNVNWPGKFEYSSQNEKRYHRQEPKIDQSECNEKE